SSNMWLWCVSTPSTIAAFVGAFLLVSRSPHRDWQYHALFLLLIQGYFFGLWFTDFFRTGMVAGGRNGVRLDSWQAVLQRSIGLVAMLNVGWLGWETCRKLRQTDLEPLYRLCRSAGSLGLSLWVLFTFRRFNLAQPWPPQLFPGL